MGAMTFPGVTAALDRYLRPDVAAPLAVGFSGGGDSLALLILTLGWARAHCRRVISLTVDHRLDPASAAWTAAALAKAAALGAEVRALAWTGDKPTTGLPAAARAARHGLLAAAARQAGARVLLLGHTADDLAEAAAMRNEGSSVSDPRVWAPSPAWPEGRDRFVLRPLLGVGRQALRAGLSARGETWLDDPANEDLKYARARARRVLASSPPLGTGAWAGRADVEPTDRVAKAVITAPTPPPQPRPASGMGYIALPRSAPTAQVAAACLCAAGTTRPPRGERLQRLVGRLRAGETFTATLAGARIEAAGDAVGVFREPGEAFRAKPSQADGPATEGMPLPVGETRVWDGRFEITALATGLTVAALRGRAARLPPAQRQALKAVAAAARPALPVVIDATGAVSCPILAGESLALARCLVQSRFEAACGLIDQEPAT